MAIRSKWEQVPFLRVTLLTAAGIVCAYFFPFGAVYALVFAFSASIYLWLHVRKKNQKLHAAIAICAYAAFFSFGALRMWQAMPRDRLSRHAPDSLVQAYEAVVISPVQRDEKGNENLTVRAERIKTAEGWVAADAHIQLFLQGDTLQAVTFGSRLLIGGTPQPIEPPKNPDGFDYGQIMRHKGIAYRHFVARGQWRLVEPPAFSLRRLALSLQQSADRALEKAVNSPVEAGLASALIIGLKDELDERLLRAYSATGIMHILAVSGLHVGILFTLIGFLLRPLQRHPRGKYAFTGIVLAVLWGYALVTGLSPSVMRAALMFSLLGIGQLFARRNAPFNTLAFSALILLAYDPLMLFQVGFQLSYAAVAGIMYFYPRFYRLWEAPHWFVDKIWQILCVSAAAQLATFPLGIYYFHQFPNYFLLANLFAVPLAFLILTNGLIVLAFSWSNLAAQLAGAALKWLIWLNNYLAFLVESLPYASAKLLYFNGLELAATYLLIIFLAAFFASKQREWLAAAAGCALVFVVSDILHAQSYVRERLMAVFHIPKHSSVLWKESGSALLQADSALLLQPRQIRYAFADFLLKRNIDWEEIPVSLLGTTDSLMACRTISGGMVYRRNGLTLCYLYRRVRSYVLPPCDVLLIAHNAVGNLDVLPRETLRQVQQIVLDGSNSAANVRRIKQQARDLGIACHAVASDGAFVRRY